MSKIAFISPDKQLFLQGRKIVQELGIERQVNIHMARLNRAVRLAQNLQNEEVDVIISRGGTARLIIDSQVNIPVVEIVITGQDLAQVFHEAKQITGVARPKVAMLAFSNMIHEIDVISKILDIDLTIYPLEGLNDIPLKLAEAATSNADILVGGMKTTIMAKHRGMKTLLLRSSDFSVKSAFQEAQKIAFGRKIEKERAFEIKALVDNSGEGIIAIDPRKIIKIFNPAAERLLKRSAHEMIGRNFDSVLDVIDIGSCLREGVETLGHIVRNGPTWITCTAIPIMIRTRIIGAIITLQDITKIQELEAKIRNEVLARRFVARYKFDDILGKSPQIEEAKRIALEIAEVDSTVLVIGESGTGKELFAQSIHNESRRKSGPFVAVNCAALPPNLLESELFGYVEGAFTGATRKGKPGLFEMAHGGTIFLDEISEMDKYGQSRLLRVLQERHVMRLGDDKYIPVDVRIIAAANKSITALVDEGEFRQDLFYRLKVLVFNLPPLNKRQGDVKFLASYFKDQFNRTYGKNIEFEEEAYSQLLKYRWRGNVRELMHFIERLVIISKEVIITGDILKLYSDDVELTIEHKQQSEIVDLTEDDKIVSALIKNNYNISKAAQMLDMDRGTFYRKLRKYKIELKKKY